MTDQEINLAIAECCGWVHVKGEEPRYGGSFERAGWISPKGRFHASDWTRKTDNGLPSYCSDLNAMHEAEMSLTKEQYRAFHDEISRWASSITTVEEGLWLYERRLSSATARQRSEAFLRTLGKWREAAPVANP
jgi:hypothetical protein